MAKQVTLRIECTVTKIVTCENCTVEEAKADPWEYAVDEHEADQIDWVVKGVEKVEE